MSDYIDFKAVLVKIDFVSKYEKICTQYNDFDSSMRGSNKDEFLKIVKKYDDKSKYIAKDRIFMSEYSVGDYYVRMGLELKDGLVQAFMFFINDEDWLLYGRLDELANQLMPSCKGQFSIPFYKNYGELDLIVNDLFLIYRNIKDEAVAVLAK